jgi:hypothetical protein
VSEKRAVSITGNVGSRKLPQREPAGVLVLIQQTRAKHL